MEVSGLRTPCRAEIENLDSNMPPGNPAQRRGVVESGVIVNPAGADIEREVVIVEVADSLSGMMRSQGGFVFGIEGWNPGPPRPVSITFFLDNTALVCDHVGRAIIGASLDGKEVRFADSPPNANRAGTYARRPQFATHAEVIAALAAEGVDWRELSWAGTPQLSLDELRTVRDELQRRLNESCIEDAEKRREAHLKSIMAVEDPVARDAQLVLLAEVEVSVDAERQRAKQTAESRLAKAMEDARQEIRPSPTPQTQPPKATTSKPKG